MADSRSELLQSRPNDQLLRDPSAATGPTTISLPAVDAEKLKARLYSYAPQKPAVNPTALRFVRPTNVQRKKAAIPSAPRLEPLVCLVHWTQTVRIGVMTETNFLAVCGNSLKFTVHRLCFLSLDCKITKNETSQSTYNERNERNWKVRAFSLFVSLQARN